MNKPKYRDDIKGQVRENIQDCEQAMRNELVHGGDFSLTAEDTSAWDEYRDMLTEAEMRAAFKRAAGA
jgi:hypothetical protein